MPAEFRIDQVTPGAGVPGRTRHDLVPNEVITLVATSPTGPGVTYTWEILDKVGSTAVLSASTGSTVTVGPNTSIVRPCSFRIKLTTNDNGAITSTIRRASVRTLVTGMFVPLFPESALSSGTLASHNADSSEDNAVYSNRAGLGIAEQNWRGWAEWAYEITLAVESGGGAGGPPTGPAGGDLGDTYPNPTVRKLWGRAVENVAPSNNDYLRWDSGTVSWRPTAFPAGLPPTGAAGGDLAGNYPAPTVARVQGFPVQSGTPTINDIWRFDGVTWTRVQHGYFIDGTDLLPSITFQADTNTGLYRPGNDRLRIVAGAGVVAEFTNSHILAQPLSAANPSYSFIGDDTTGMSNPSAGEIVLSTAGTERVRVTSTTLTMVGVIQTGDGAVGAPSYAFTSDPNTGLYSFGADKLGISTGGVQRVGVSDSVIDASLRIAGIDGNAALPGFSFMSTPGMGVYRTGDLLGFATAGAQAALLNSLLNDAVGDEVGALFTTTVNKAAGNYIGLRVNATETAAPGTDNRLIDAQVGGTSRAAITSVGHVLAGFGTAALPGVSFLGDPDTGMFMTGAGASLRFSVQGTERFQMTTAALGPLTTDTYSIGESTLRWSRAFLAAGAVATPSLTVGADANSGLYLAGSAGTQVLNVGVNGAQVAEFSTGQFRALSGSVGAPGISFIADTDSGIAFLSGRVVVVSNNAEKIRVGANIFILTTIEPNVTNTHDIGTSSVLFRDGFFTRLLAGNGTAGAPSFTFGGDTNTGLYSVGADQIGISTNGTLRVTVDTTDVTSTLTFQGPTGTKTAPTYGFSAEAGIGMYRSAGGDLFFSQGDADVLQVSSGASWVAPGADNTYALGDATLRWSDVFAVQTTIGDLTLRNPYRLSGDRDAEHWKIVEAADCIFAFNIRTGQKFRLAMTEEPVLTEDDTNTIKKERTRFGWS